MSLYLKYRPTSFKEMWGNSDVISTLEGMLKDLTRCPRTFLFHGPTGTGKTTIARIIADMIGVKGFDLKEINSADFRGIDTVREIIKNSQFQPMEGAYRMWIIDEAHKLTADAQNAFLKILEDTPPQVFFIICTTEPEKLIDTIRGRCQQFQMKPLNDRQMLGLLKYIVREENAIVDREVYDQIILDSFGLPRNAIQILEQVLNVEPERRLEVARKAAERQSQSIELCRALLNGASWKEVSSILSGLKDEQPEGIRRHIMAYCQSVLLKGENDRAGLILESFWEPLFNTGMPGLVYVCYSICRRR